MEKICKKSTGETETKRPPSSNLPESANEEDLKEKHRFLILSSHLPSEPNAETVETALGAHLQPSIPGSNDALSLRQVSEKREDFSSPNSSIYSDPDNNFSNLNQSNQPGYDKTDLSYIDCDPATFGEPPTPARKRVFSESDLPVEDQRKWSQISNSSCFSSSPQTPPDLFNSPFSTNIKNLIQQQPSPIHFTKPIANSYNDNFNNTDNYCNQNVVKYNKPSDNFKNKNDNNLRPNICCKRRPSGGINIGNNWMSSISSITDVDPGDPLQNVHPNGNLIRSRNSCHAGDSFYSNPSTNHRPGFGDGMEIPDDSSILKNYLNVPGIGSRLMHPRSPSASIQSVSDMASTCMEIQLMSPDQDPPEMLEEYENVTLMYVKHEKIPMKDFGSEVRATMDIDHLLNKAVLLLDLPETSLEEIFGKIIHVMDIQEPEFTSEQVKNALFTQDAGNQFHILSRTVQSICTTNIGGGTFDYDQAWICALCMLPTVQHRHVAIARLSHPTNLGRTMQDLRFIMIVIAPARAKGTKTALETARTFATLFADLDIRQRLVMASNADQFRQTLLHAAKELAIEQTQLRERKISIHFSDAKQQILGPNKWFLGRGLKEDFFRRKKHYIRDYLDGFSDRKTVQKVISTTVFVYFACLLPSIAFGVLNYDNTDGAIGVKKAIYAQAIGGLFFSIFGGQPMIIILTTAPLALYTKIIFKLSQNFGVSFLPMYAWSGLWCQFFLIFYAVTELSNIMKWATRSAEEMFSLFIALAFVVESFKALSGNFRDNYHSPYCERKSYDSAHNITGFANSSSAAVGDCRRDSSLLYLLLMLGTLWIGLFLYNFKKTPYLTVAKREMLADYSFPAAVIIMSFCGSYCFRDVYIHRFEFNQTIPVLQVTNLLDAGPFEILGAMGLGFCLSLLFFIDQNMTSAIVNNQQNKLHKGSATHLDLLVVAMLNIFLSIMGLPWMHAALPHSPLHVRALANVEERVQQGHVHEVITNVRETRVSALIAHVLILISAWCLLPEPLDYIPRSVLDGLFLYMAATSLHGNELVERIMLLFTEQAAYPPTHYIRRVPQRKVHLFTVCQLVQLAALCVFGFTPVPYVEMVFPVVIFCFLPIRHLLIPKVIDYKYLDALDGRH